MNKQIEQAVDQDDVTEYLNFEVNNVAMAIPIVCVKEIVAAKDLSALPLSPASVVGALNLRGKAIPVIDLRRRLELGCTDEEQQRRCVIVVDRDSTNPGNSVGVLVDEVCSVVVKRKSDIDKPPSYEGKIPCGLIQGMFNQEDQFVLALNLDTVLDVVQDDEPEPALV